jgi:CRP/FNR family transcriptional regulator, cyclic AMP receptor protein
MHSHSAGMLSAEAKETRVDQLRERLIKPLFLVDVLEPLSEEDLEELAHRCPDTHLNEGEEFYRPREHDGGLFLIKSGRVMVYTLSPRGKQLTLILLGGGTVLTSRRMQGLHAKALEPSVVTFMGRQYLEHLIHKRPEVGLRLLDLLADRLRAMDQRMCDVVHKDVPARLAALILQLLESEGIVESKGGYRLPTKYTHDQLAAMIGAKRVAVTRAFKHLREAGIVETKQRRIHVRDMEALEHAAAKERT